MARCAQLVIFKFYFRGVRIVAIRALDAFVVHLALNEGSIDVDFIHDLTIGMIRLWP